MYLFPEYQIWFSYVFSLQPHPQCHLLYCPRRENKQQPWSKLHKMCLTGCFRLNKSFTFLSIYTVTCANIGNVLTTLSSTSLIFTNKWLSTYSFFMEKKINKKINICIHCTPSFLQKTSLLCECKNNNNKSASSFLSFSGTQFFVVIIKVRNFRYHVYLFVIVCIFFSSVIPSKLILSMFFKCDIFKT